MCGSLNSLSETLKIALQLSLGWPEKKSKRDSDGSDVTAVETSTEFEYDVEKILNVRYPGSGRIRPKVVIDRCDVSVSTDPPSESSPTTLVEASGALFPDPITTCPVDQAENAIETEPRPTNGVDLRKEGKPNKLKKMKSILKRSRDSEFDAIEPPVPSKVCQTESLEYRPELANEHEGHAESFRMGGKFKNWMMKSKEFTRGPDAPISAQTTDEAMWHQNDSTFHDTHVLTSDQADHCEGTVRKEGKLKTLIKTRSLSRKARYNEDKATTVDSHSEKKEHEAGGTSKLKAWIKRKLLNRKVSIVWEVEDDIDCAVGREVKPQFAPPRVAEEYWQTYEMNSHHISQTFPVVGRDLQAIGRRLSSVSSCF